MNLIKICFCLYLLATLQACNLFTNSSNDDQSSSIPQLKLEFNENNQQQINWKADNNSASYALLISSSNEFPDSQTTLIDSITPPYLISAENGTPKYFAKLILSFDDDNILSSKSINFSAQPLTPINVKTNISKDSTLILTWDATQEAESYTLYRNIGDSFDKSTAKITQNVSSPFEDVDIESNQDYFYRLVTVVGTQESQYSIITNGYVYDPNKPKLSNRPKIISTSPSHLEDNVSTSMQEILITFDADMSKKSISSDSLRLISENDEIVPSMVSYNHSEKTAIIKPENKLVAGTSYLITVDSSVTDINNLSLTEKIELKFSSEQFVSGLAIAGGRISFAKVFIDENMNDILDESEFSALTDSRGYFSYSPSYMKKGELQPAVNYCDFDPHESERHHCLKFPSDVNNAVVKVFHGYNILTVEAFDNTISAKVAANSNTLDQFHLIDPISSFLAILTEQQNANFTVNDSYFDQDMYSYNYLDFNVSLLDDQRLTQIQLATKLQAVANSVSNILNSALDQTFIADPNTVEADGGFFGVHKNIPVNGDLFVYQAIADALTSIRSLKTLLSEQTHLESIILNAWIFMKSFISDYNNNRPNSEQYLLPPDDPDISSIAANCLVLSNTIDQLFSNPLVASGLYTTLNGDIANYDISDDAKSRLKAIDILTKLIAGVALPNVISNAVFLSTDATYLQNLKNPKVDLYDLKQKFINNPGYLSADDANYDNRLSFDELLGNGGFSNIEPINNSVGLGGNTLQLSNSEGDYVVIQFESVNDDSISGTTILDILFTSGPLSRIDENGNITSLQLAGEWTQLDDHSLQITVTVANEIIPIVIKPTLDENGNPSYNLDFGDGQYIWVP